MEPSERARKRAYSGDTHLAQLFVGLVDVGRVLEDLAQVAAKAAVCAQNGPHPTHTQKKGEEERGSSVGNSRMSSLLYLLSDAVQPGSVRYIRALTPGKSRRGEEGGRAKKRPVALPPQLGDRLREHAHVLLERLRSPQGT